MARTPKAAPPKRSNTELRGLVLKYFYDRSQNATSMYGKRGIAAKISDVKRDLKAQHGLTQQEVVGNLHYLISEGWVEETAIEKQVPLRSGTVVPNTTSFYKITARGTDKIEGPGEFTMDRFKGIRIEATGQNIITVGDGNQINAKHQDVGTALAEFREAVVAAPDLDEAAKVEVVADLDTIQSQLAKSEPNRSVLSASWEGIKGAATVTSLSTNIAKITELLSPLF